jgi:hypothetical protein
MRKRPTEEGKRLVWDKKSKTYVEPEHRASTGCLAHYSFPADAMETLCAQKQDATLSVLLNIVRHWFYNFQQNPVKLATTEIRGFEISRNQKARALTALEAAGLVTVERRPRKSPLVTLNWKPTKKNFS